MNCGMTKMSPIAGKTMRATVTTPVQKRYLRTLSLAL